MFFFLHICNKVYISLVLKQASDEEGNSGPAIFDIIAIDPTTTVSADSSFFSVKCYCNRER